MIDDTALAATVWELDEPPSDDDPYIDLYDNPYGDDQPLNLTGGTANPGPALLPSPTNPMAVARELLPAWQYRSILTLRRWRGTWMRWEGPHWVEIDAEAMQAYLYPRLEHATYLSVDKNGEEKKLPWAPTRAKVANLMEATGAITHLAAEVETPSWLAALELVGASAQVVACRNGLLDVPTRKLQPLTPLYFNRVSVPFDYVADFPTPARWLGFLDSIWPGDPEAVQALQEFFGYVISGRTDLQKMMLIIGPPRSGKGTIARILTALVGKANMAGPTLASLATNFGLSPLLDKSLAIISDARLPRLGAEIVVERLLSISGEDTLDVDRKYRDPWTGRIPARFLILSNELPAFADASGAIASRLIVLTMTTSHLGKEDTSLDRDLTRELPGILNWALNGLTRVAARGRFLEPKSSAEAVAMLAATVSPTNAFLKDCCTVGPDERAPVDVLWEAWRDWCDSAGRDHKGTKETFGRNLLAAVPGLKRSKARTNGAQVPVYLGVSLGVADDPEPPP